MTQEEKAKRYDETLERAKKLYGKYCINNVLESLFPELKESEDEKIRKSIIAILNNYVDDSNTFKPKMISWLEKQCKQEEPQVYETKDGEVITYSETDGYKVVEPKFKVGDWIIRSDERFKHNTYLLTEVKDYYVCEELKGRRVTFTFNDAHRNFKLWDISDAKDGDVLYCKSLGTTFIMILKCINQNRSLDSYCRYNTMDGFGIDVPRVMSINDNPKPASKEQRDLLFSKMKEAGYEWDEEKKELKKNEQKPKWSEEDNKIIEEIINDIECARAINYHAPKEGYEFRENWLKSLKQRIGG